MEITEKTYKIKPFILKEINLISYVISIKNEALIIDPSRNINIFKKYIKDNNLKLKYLIITHFQNQFCKGHLQLSQEYDIPVYAGKIDNDLYEYESAIDKKDLNFENIKLEFIETPGHTLESISVLLKELDMEKNEYKEKYLFSGEILSTKNIGIPSIFDKKNESITCLTDFLYSSIKKLITLDENTVVLSSHYDYEKFLSLKDIKILNKYLRFKDKEEFEYLVNKDVPHPLKWKEKIFFKNNKILDLDEVLKNYLEKQIESNNLNEIIKNNPEDYILIDLRNSNEFSKKHILNSINIPIDFNFFTILRNYISFNKKIILIGEKDDYFDSLLNCWILNYYNIEYHFNSNNLDKIDDNYLCGVDFINVNEIDKKNNNIFIDLRSKKEWNKGIIKNSYQINYLNLNNFPILCEQEGNKLLYCKVASRSIIGYSFLKFRGIKNLKVINGGYVSLLYSGFKLL